MATRDIVPRADSEGGIGTTLKRWANAWFDAINGKDISSGVATTGELTTHTGNTLNPHNVTKAQVGLGNCDNTADASKPVSSAQQTALDGKVSHSLATAANDMLVASGAGAFVKKTLAEVKTILGLGTAAYTASTDYATAAKGVTNGDNHDHSGGDGGTIAYASISGTPTIPAAGSTEPGVVASSTSGAAGSAATFSRSDHNHDLGEHTHRDATTGGALGKVDYHGIETGFTSISMAGDVLTIGAATNKYWYQGVPFSTTNSITCDLSSTAARDGSDAAKQTNRLYYVYFKDATGTLYWSQQQWSLMTKVPVATAYYNGSAWAVGRETHSYSRNLAWHENAHRTIGARYESGLDKTLPTAGTPATLTITSGTIYDEDIAVSIAQQTTARAWYQASSGVYTFADISLPYTGASGAPTFLDTDTYALATLGTNKFACYWVYASNDVNRPIYIIPSHISDGYATISLARAETPPALAGLGLSPEIKLLYRWIYKSDGSFQESADYRTVSSLPSGFTASTTASSVSFTPAGNIAASTVQAAIEELDTEKIPTTTGAATAYVDAATTSAAGKVQLATNSDAITGTDTAKAVTPAALAAAFLSAIGIDAIDVPRNAMLGTAAYLDQMWLYASTTWDAPSCANAAQVSTTVAVPGAEIGDKVMPSASIALSGLNLRGEVTATDVVTLYLSNLTGAAVDLASATYYVAVLKRTPAR